MFSLSVETFYLLTIFALKFEISYSAVCMANSVPVNSDQPPCSAASDLGLSCLQMPIYPNT